MCEEIMSKIKTCETLLENGRYVEAILDLYYLSAKYLGENVSSIDRLFERAYRQCVAHYTVTRQELFSVIETTSSYQKMWTAIELLKGFGDYQLLDSCRPLEVNVATDEFLYGFSEYIGEVLYSVVDKKELYFGKGMIADTKVLLSKQADNFFGIYRDPDFISTPLLNNKRRVKLGKSVWMAGCDPTTRSFIATLHHDDSVIMIDSETLELKKCLKGSITGVRGLGVVPEARRAFINSEYENKMYSLDLDNFEIRKEINGFSVRPERIVIDPEGKTLVTGNLGSKPLDMVMRIKMEKVCNNEGMIKDGMAMTLVDVAKETVVNTLDTGRRPTAVDISGKYIAAGNFWDNTITIYSRGDLTDSFSVSLNNLINHIDLDFILHDRFLRKDVKLNHSLKPRLVEGIAILDNRGWVLVSGFDGCFVSVIDIDSRKVVSLVPVQNRPFDVVVDDEEKYAYVSCHSSNQISVVDLDLLEEICRFETGAFPMDLCLHDHILLVPHTDGLDIFDLKKAMSLL